MQWRPTNEMRSLISLRTDKRTGLTPTLAKKGNFALHQASGTLETKIFLNRISPSSETWP